MFSPLLVTITTGIAMMMLSNISRWYKVCVELFGGTHPRVQRCIRALSEQRYRKIAEQRNIVIEQIQLDDKERQIVCLM